MEPCNDLPRSLDLSTAWSHKKLRPGHYKMKRAAAAVAERGSPPSAQERRLAAHNLRPTSARTSVLRVLEQAAPSCLDANQLYRTLNGQPNPVTPGAVYRALHDLWNAGLLVRTEGARGRAFYVAKPEALNDSYATLRCHCGARLVFIEDLALREHLQSLACEQGFAFEERSVFTITTTCAHCRQYPHDS